MENIKRENGFIDLDELGKDSSFRNIPWRDNKSMLEEYGYSQIKYIFYYKNEIFLYKRLSYDFICYLVLNR